LDFPGWPAGRGAEQYDYEPPRVVEGKTVTNRAQRIKMLGNAVVPQQAAILFEAIMEMERRFAG
jgi:DNA (cytosine-5)-methyltransferase 1